MLQDLVNQSFLFPYVQVDGACDGVINCKEQVCPVASKRGALCLRWNQFGRTQPLVLCSSPFFSSAYLAGAAVVFWLCAFHNNHADILTYAFLQSRFCLGLIFSFEKYVVFIFVLAFAACSGLPILLSKAGLGHFGDTSAETASCYK